MGFWRTFFRKPAQATGTPLNIYMFTPTALVRHTTTLIKDPRYFVNRLRVMVYQVVHPRDPWLTAESIRLINKKLAKDMRGFEWGSGRSTIYFAERLQHLVSVEHDHDWWQRVSKQLEKRRLANVTYQFVDLTVDRDAYHQVIAAYPDGYFDLILVDGESRENCVRAAVPKLRSGGYLVLDNSEESVDTSACAKLERIDAHNGVWTTTVFIKAS